METRQTTQKKEILNVILGEGKHMRAEDVKRTLDANGGSVSLATVYRNLNRLVEEGVISRITTENYVIYDGNAEPHDHFHCIRCGNYFDVPRSENVDEVKDVENNIHAKVLYQSTIFDGICYDCLSKEEN